jgi:hypothetical protein
MEVDELRKIAPGWADVLIEPLGQGALATYGSFSEADEMNEEPQQSGTLLVLVPNALKAYSLKAEVSWQARAVSGQVNMTAIPITSVLSVHTDQSFHWRPQREGIRPVMVAVELDRELEPFGKMIELPHDVQRDYGGRVEESKAAALAFAVAVLSVLPA